MKEKIAFQETLWPHNALQRALAYSDTKLEESEALSRKGFSTPQKDHVDYTHLHDSYKPSAREAF